MQTITISWFVQGMIKATSDAWLKGWDERNGGNLTLRLDDADIEPYAADFHQKPRYIALSQPMPLLANTPFIVPVPASSSVTFSWTRKPISAS